MNLAILYADFEIDSNNNDMFVITPEEIILIYLVILIMNRMKTLQ